MLTYDLYTYASYSITPLPPIYIHNLFVLYHVLSLNYFIWSKYSYLAFNMIDIALSLCMCHQIYDYVCIFVGVGGWVGGWGGGLLMACTLPHPSLG